MQSHLIRSIKSIVAPNRDAPSNSRRLCAWLGRPRARRESIASHLATTAPTHAPHDDRSRGRVNAPSAREQFSEKRLGLRKAAVVDLRRPHAVDVEIGGIGDIVLMAEKPVMHPRNEQWI